MRQIFAICRREFNSYFKSPMGWVVFAIYAFVSGLYFSSMLLSGYSDVAAILQFMKSLFFVLIPIITMRTISEDKKNGTLVLLTTSPASTGQIVIGKYLGVVLMFMTVSSANIIYLLCTLGLGGTADSRFWGTLIAYLLTAFAYIAIGIFASALTENQIIAAIISFVIFIGFDILNALSSIMGTLVTSFFNKIDFFNIIPPTFDQSAGHAVVAALEWINPTNRLSSFYKGTFDLLSVIYFVGLIMIFLYSTYQIMESRRWAE